MTYTLTPAELETRAEMLAYAVATFGVAATTAALADPHTLGRFNAMAAHLTPPPTPHVRQQIMARTRIQINATGHYGQDIDWPAYALADRNDPEYPGDADVIAAAVARRNRLQVVSISSDGWQEGRDGKATARFCRATLGRPISRQQGGGWTCDAEIAWKIITEATA